MSSVSYTSNVYSALMPAMTTGVAKVTLSNPIFANYFPSTSKIIGCQRVTAGGTTGQPRACIRCDRIASEHNCITELY